MPIVGVVVMYYLQKTNLYYKYLLLISNKNFVIFKTTFLSSVVVIFVVALLKMRYTSHVGVIVVFCITLVWSQNCTYTATDGSYYDLSALKLPPTPYCDLLQCYYSHSTLEEPQIIVSVPPLQHITLVSYHTLSTIIYLIQKDICGQLVNNSHGTNCVYVSVCQAEYGQSNSCGNTPFTFYESGMG